MKSKCCNADVNTMGDGTTHYYSCTLCNQPCDLTDSQEPDGWLTEEEYKIEAKEKFGNEKYLTDKEEGFRQGVRYAQSLLKSRGMVSKKEHEREIEEFGDWVIENYAKCKSVTGVIAYINIKTNNVLVNGTPSYYTRLINEHGKTISQLLQLFKQDNNKDK